MNEETWEKRSRDGRTQGSTFDIIEQKTRRRVAAMVSKTDADRIISDHQQVAALKAALEDGLAETQAVTNGQPTDWYWMAQRRRQAMLEALAAISGREETT